MSAPGDFYGSFQRYCEAVCAYVRFRPDHGAISRELTAHLEDHADALAERHPELPPTEARRRAIAAMGDPEELGRALDQLHSPLLGWLQIWWIRSARLLAVLALLLALTRADALFTAFTAPSEYGFHMAALVERYEELDLVADFRPQEIWRQGGYTFSIERALVTRSADTAYGRESLSLAYQLRVTHPNPWQRAPDFRAWLWAEDDLGNHYPSRGQQEQYGLPVRAGDSAGNPIASTPFVSYYDLWVAGIDPDAKELTLRFDRYGENAIYLTVPLEGGVSHG